MQAKSAGAIVFRTENKDSVKDIKYLILLYGSGHWDYVKGHVEADEEDEETVVREAEEEAGLIDLRILPGFKEKITYTYKNGNTPINKEVIFFLAQTQTNAIKLSFEHKDYKWLDYDKAIKQVTYKNGKDVLKKAHAFLQKYLSQKPLSF